LGGSHTLGMAAGKALNFITFVEVWVNVVNL